jgi:hypothetical protein
VNIDRRLSTTMTNEKWQMTYGKSGCGGWIDDTHDFPFAIY